MASTTYVDNFTITDIVNETRDDSDATDTFSVQYTSNEGAGTMNEDLYAPTAVATHTIPTAIRAMRTGAILSDGYSQKSLYELMLQIQINWDTAMASLDDSGGVAATTFVSTASISTGLAVPLSGTYNATFMATTIGKTLGLERSSAIGLNPNGMGAREIAIFCQALTTQIATATALMDADATLSDINYGLTATTVPINMYFTAKTGWCPPLATTDAFDITNPASKIKTTGIHQEALVDYLNTAIRHINALWAKLDADI